MDLDGCHCQPEHGSLMWIESGVGRETIKKMWKVKHFLFLLVLIGLGNLDRGNLLAASGVQALFFSLL